MAWLDSCGWLGWLVGVVDLHNKVLRTCANRFAINSGAQQRLYGRELLKPPRPRVWLIKILNIDQTLVGRSSLLRTITDRLPSTGEATILGFMISVIKSQYLWWWWAWTTKLGAFIVVRLLRFLLRPLVGGCLCPRDCLSGQFSSSCLSGLQ